MLNKILIEIECATATFSTHISTQLFFSKLLEKKCLRNVNITTILIFVKLENLKERI